MIALLAALLLPVDSVPVPMPGSPERPVAQIPVSLPMASMSIFPRSAIWGTVGAGSTVGAGLEVGTGLTVSLPRPASLAWRAGGSEPASGLPAATSRGPRAELPSPRFMPDFMSDPSVEPTLASNPLLGSHLEPAPAPPQLVEYSDGYLTRLKIHKYASYATLPLFAAAYVTGNELITKGENAASWARNTHGAIAGSLGALFAINTITGVWNLYEGRHDPEGRTRRIIHSVLLLAADAGFLATAALAGESEGGEGGFERGGEGGDNTAHRAMAITSMGLAFTGYMTMSWPFRRD